MGVQGLSAIPAAYTVFPQYGVQQAGNAFAYGPALLLQQLGAETKIDTKSGLVQFNTALVDQCVSYRENIVPLLGEVLGTSQNRLQIIEGLRVAEQLAEKKVGGLMPLYATVSQRLNHTPDPYIQAYLAGFYRQLKEPSAFGPMLKMLMTNTVRHPFDPNEEIGGTLLSLIADQTAKRLQSSPQHLSVPGR